MLITGYHGTSKDIASKIIEKKYFMISNGDKEWLGRGIYFYTNYEDALEWSKLKYDTAFSVLHTIIEINQEEFIDFDTEEGKEIFECFKSLFNKHGIEQYDSVQKNQCAVMNFIWEHEINIKVLMCSFATKPNVFRTLNDGRRKRKEFCARNNDVIKGLTLIKE